MKIRKKKIHYYADLSEDGIVCITLDGPSFKGIIKTAKRSIKDNSLDGKLKIINIEKHIEIIEYLKDIKISKF